MNSQKYFGWLKTWFLVTACPLLSQIRSVQVTSLLLFNALRITKKPKMFFIPAWSSQEAVEVSVSLLSQDLCWLVGWLQAAG